MAKKIYNYEATIRLKVRADDRADAIQLARAAMLDVRAVAYDGLEGEVTVHGGAPKPAAPKRRIRAGVA